MSRGSASTIVVLTGLGLACGVLCAGVFHWWWSSHTTSGVVITGSYTPIPGVPISNSPADDLNEAVRNRNRPDVQAWLYPVLIGAPTLLGLVTGFGSAIAGWRFARG